MKQLAHLGKYEILAELGRGGYAITYRATDHDLDREVALKVLKPGWLDDAVAVERFMREARVAAKLHHPHIASIYDVGQVDGRLFIAMHLVEGRPLDRILLEDGPFQWARALTILDDIASALDYAHERGLIHRDVKPANIVVSDEEGAVLTDFGLVKAAQSASTTSASLTGASTPGTSAYIAPEIWAGQPATAASDLYALAAVAGEMLTGKSLFGADTVEAVIARHLALGPAWPETFPADSPINAQNVIEKALKRKPDERYSTVVEFAQALHDVNKSSQFIPPPFASVVAEPSYAVKQHAQKPQQPLPAPLQLTRYWPIVGGIVLLIVLGTIGMTSGWFQDVTIPPTSEPTVVPTSSAAPSTPTKSATFTPEPTFTIAPSPTAEPSPAPTATLTPHEAEFITSAHANATAEAFVHWDNADPAEIPVTCAKCHSVMGLPLFIANNGTLVIAQSGLQTTGVVAQPLAKGFACNTCHDPANFPARYALNSVPFPNGAQLTFSTEKDNQGNLKPDDSNLCIECHQGRESTVTVNNFLAGKEVNKVDPEIGFKNIHGFAAGATLFGTESEGAYEYDGQKYNGRNRHVEDINTCTACHDAHTLTVRVDKCAACHSNIKATADLKNSRVSTVDYNGNGDTREGIYWEVDGFRAALYAEIQRYAIERTGTPIVYDQTSYPYFFVADKAGNKIMDNNGAPVVYNAYTPRLLKAAYNYQFSTKDFGAFAHNPTYVMQFLYDSIKDLGGNINGFVRP